MNGYRRRSAIVAVALVATMSAGAVLAADTGLPPGFVKSSLSSLSSGGTTVSKTLAWQSLSAGILTSTGYKTTKVAGMLERGGIAAVGQALKQSDEMGVAAGAGYVSTLRSPKLNNALASAEFAANRSGSSLVDLTSLAQGLTDGTSGGRETLANSDFGASRPSYAMQGRLTGENGLLASTRNSGAPDFSLAQLADALTGGTIAGRETRASSGLPTSGASYDGRGRFTGERGFSSFGNALPTNGASYSAPGGDNGTFGATVASPRRHGTPSIGLTQLAAALDIDGSEVASFATGRIDNGSALRSGTASAIVAKATYSRGLTEASSINAAGLAEALTGN